MGLAKFTRDGELDTTFGAGGRVRIEAIPDDSLGTWSFIPFGSDFFVAASATLWTETKWAIPLLLKLHADGTLDRSYAQGGVLRLPFALSLADTATYPFPSSAQYALAASDAGVWSARATRRGRP